MAEMVTTFEKQMPELLQVFETCLRSGYNITQSLEIVAKDLDDPAASDARRVVEDVAGGMGFDQALDRWLERTPSRDLDLLIATLRVQREVGGNLANKVNLLAQILEKRKGI
jgi:tight adherence protein B